MMELTPWDPFLMSSGFPKVDMQENKDSIILTAEIPGITPEKLNVEVGEDTVKLSAHLEEEKEQKNKGYYHKERSVRSFQRVFALPCKVKHSEVKATCKNGILTVIMPKTTHGEAVMKRIPVEEG